MKTIKEEYIDAITAPKSSRQPYAGFSTGESDTKRTGERGNQREETSVLCGAQSTRGLGAERT